MRQITLLQTFYVVYPRYLYLEVLKEVHGAFFWFFASRLLRYETEQSNYAGENCHPELHECLQATELQEWEEGLVQELFSTSAVGIQHGTLVDLRSIHFTLHTFLRLCLLTALSLIKARFLFTGRYLGSNNLWSLCVCACTWGVTQCL